MVQLNWSEMVSNTEAVERAGGWRPLKTQRKRRALARHERVINLFVACGSHWQWGVKSKVARELGVSRRTIDRYLAWLLSL